MLLSGSRSTRPRHCGIVSQTTGIVAGAALPIAVSELEVEGDAFVTALSPCPPVAEGPGRVVTGRFVTRDAGNLVQLALENGTEIRATDVHPIWSMDREEWIPAGELVPGELVDTLAGPVAVKTVERLHSDHDVYNIEVHGEHVFRVTADGVLVHNAYAAPNGTIISRVKESSALVRGAETAGGSAQASLDKLTLQLARGNLDPGIGTKTIGNGIMEARARDGARVYFRQLTDGAIEILGKSTKANQPSVIAELLRLFGGS